MAVAHTIPFLSFTTRTGGRFFWTALLLPLLLAMLAYLGMSAWRSVRDQLETQDWPSVVGVIKSSEVVETGSGKSRSSRPVVKYLYEVAGRKYEGDRIYRKRRGSLTFDAGAGRAALLVSEYPKGESVYVWYNPRDPAEAVLDNRLLAEHYMSLLLIVPIAIITLGRVFALADAVWQRTFRRSPARALVRDGRIHVALPPAGPVEFGAKVAAVTSIVVMVAEYIIIQNQTSEPTLEAILAIAGGTLAFGVAAGIWRALRIRRGAFDMIIDPDAGTVRFASTAKAWAGEICDISDIETVSVKDVDCRPWWMGKRWSTTCPAPHVCLAGGGDVQLATWLDPRKSEEFGRWLSRVLTDGPVQNPRSMGARPLRAR